MNAFKIRLSLLAIAVLTGCSTPISERPVASEWHDEPLDMRVSSSGGPVEVRPVSLMAGAKNGSGQSYLALTITNTSASPILISTRAVLLPSGDSWERNFEIGYYFVCTQLSAPEVPSIASSIELDAGSGGIYSITPILSSKPFRLEFVCFPKRKGYLAKLVGNTQGDQYLGESFLASTPLIEQEESLNLDSDVAPSK